MKRTLAAVSLAAVLMAGVAAIGVTLAAPQAQWSPQPLTGFLAIAHPSEAVDAATATASDSSASGGTDPTATAIPSQTATGTTEVTASPTPDATFGRPPQSRPKPSAQSVTVRTVVTKTPPPPPPTPAPVAPAPAPVAPRPVSGGSATVAAARSYALSRIGSAQYSCLDVLWSHESSWNPFAQNRSSGAYGIPQALPGSKMASAGADWATNPVTQVKWGLSYISGRYGSACGAWSFWQAHHWY